MNTDVTKTEKQKKRVIHGTYDPATEEAWLQSMADKGWALESVRHTFYTFTKCAPRTYIVKLTLAKNRTERLHIEEILTESGATICPVKFNPFSWIYAIRERSLGDFEINTTLQSKARFDLLWLKRLRVLLAIDLITAFLALVAGILLDVTGVLHNSSINWSVFLIGIASGLVVPILPLVLPLYLKVSKKIKAYKEDSSIYAN